MGHGHVRHRGDDVRLALVLLAAAVGHPIDPGPVLLPAWYIYVILDPHSVAHLDPEIQ
jgi:hypothetical protein